MQQLAYIKSNFSLFPQIITKLEKQDVSLVESVNLIETFKQDIQHKIKGKIGNCISKKLSDTLAKNEGFQILSNVAKVLTGDVIEDLTIAPNIISALSNAPITSVDVERSFSAYRHILSDRRQSFLSDNIEKHLVVSLYASCSEKF